MEVKMNKVVRKCDSCGATDRWRINFTYLGDSVWSCHMCGSKYTHVETVEAITSR